ncbi:MAG: hypothetical protein ABF291_10895 [Desulfobacterales bacterium]
MLQSDRIITNFDVSRIKLPMGLIGIMATLFVLVALVSALTVSLKRPWTKIVVRVAGSWVAAMGMLMFGWLFRGHGLK